MAVYYQHIGEKLSQRDFPRSLGTPTDGLKRFKFEHIEEYLTHLSSYEQLDIQRKCTELGPTGFQIWGIPSGAQKVLSRMTTGDYLMLLESVNFQYCGQAIHKTSDMCYDLSEHIWGEQRFPIIVLLQGELISYDWEDFVADFDFKPNYYMRGQTMRLRPDRIAQSKFGNEDVFISRLLSGKSVSEKEGERGFYPFSKTPVARLREVKEQERDREFRSSVLERQGTLCAFCGLDIEVALDVAHIVPKAEQGADDPRNGIVLCATHHRMFYADIVGIEPDSLSVATIPGLGLDQLRISHSSLTHLQAHPHIDALRLRWTKFQSKPRK